MATTYTFEHICSPKTIDLSFPTRDPMRERERPYPAENNLTGGVKSHVYNRSQHYDPSNRQWQKHHEKMALPRERVAGQLTFETEDQWVDWQDRRDRSYSTLCAGAGFRNSSCTDLDQKGYAFCPYNLYRTGIPPLSLYNAHNPWPKTEIRSFPTWRGPRGYYGYYHEELDVHKDGGYRYPRDPRVLVNDEDVLKYEYMRSVPSCHLKLPVEYPVLM